jgi:hypothetical protein
MTTMPDSDKNTQPPQSLFEQKDILHDIETVQAKWAREQGRRRKLMVKIFCVGGLFLFALLGCLLYRIHRQAEFRRALELQEQRKYNPIGYKDAKIHILFFFSDSSDRTEELLREAVNNKPSEFYVEFKPLEGIDGEEAEKALGTFRPGLTINGQHTFKIKDENGTEKTIQLFDENYSYKIKELALILNQLHQQIYGESYLLPINSQFESRVQNIEIEGVDDDSTTVKESTKKDHDHDEEEKADLKEEGVIERQPFSPDELIVPKLDVKDKK